MEEVEHLNIYKKPNKKITNLAYMDFVEPITIKDINDYGKIDKGLYWNIDKNQKVIGIYYNKENEVRLRHKIHDLMDFYDSVYYNIDYDSYDSACYHTLTLAYKLP